MKKTFAMLLALTLLLSLSACGLGQETENREPSDPFQSLTPPSQSANDPSPAVGEPDDGFDPSATLEETVLVDEADVKITATEIKYAAYSVKLTLAIENNTGKNLSFYSGTLGYSCNSVNGYMVDDGYLNVDVAAGKKANETVSFDVDELTLLGLSDIADIEMGFHITDDSYHDYLTTGPRSLKTSLADTYDYAADTYRSAVTSGSLAKQVGLTVDHHADQEIFNPKGIRLVSQTMVTNSGGEQILLVEAENTSADMVYVSVGDVAVNGLTVQSGTWTTEWVGAGKRRVIPLELAYMVDESYREPFGIDAVGSVSYSFEIKDFERDTLVAPQVLTFSDPGNAARYDASGQELYQSDSLRIVSKGLVPDSFAYSDDIHLLFLVENGFSQQLLFDVDSSSVSINGYMTGILCFGQQAAAGGSAVLDVELQGYSLEQNGITSLEDIKEASLTFEVRDDDYKLVGELAVTIQF